jgi:serine O-acetyltransferase
MIARDVLRWWDEVYAGLKFSTENITDLESLTAKLKQPLQHTGICHYLAERLSGATWDLLICYTGGPDKQLQQALAGELNRAIQSNSIYEGGRFAGLALSAETQHLLDSGSGDYHFLRLNRLLLEDAFPQEITRCERHKLPTVQGKLLVGALLRLMSNLPEFRSLFYYRIKGSFPVRALLKSLAPPLSSLYIHTPEIGPGLFIQHGFATIIAANRIGRNCWINQQVTIGYSDAMGCPTLGDNVHVYAGAKIIGGVTVGDNVNVGANAVVVKDVPHNCTVVGVPARIVRQGGKRTTEAVLSENQQEA